MIIVLLLADRGMKRKEIAKILDVSEKTIQRMFSGHFEIIQGANKGK